MDRRIARPSLWSNFKTVLRNTWNCISHCNPPAAICSHLIGKNHSHAHRLLVGTIIMAVGVIVSKNGGLVMGTVLPYSLEHASHYFFDLVGYLGHGIGAMPFLESLERYRTGSGD